MHPMHGINMRALMPLYWPIVMCLLMPACVTCCPAYGPGIGKSMLGYLLLYRWVCEGRGVVLRKAGFLDEAPVLLCADGAVELTKHACMKVLKTKKSGAQCSRAR